MPVKTKAEKAAQRAKSLAVLGKMTKRNEAKKAKVAAQKKAKSAAKPKPKMKYKGGASGKSAKKATKGSSAYKGR